MTGAALLSFILFKPSILLANATNAIDIPNSRKTHTQPTARVGGFAFFIAFLTFLPLLPINMNWKISLILGGGTIFLVGFLDDALQLTPFAKLFGQIIASCLYFFTAVPNLNIITGAILIFWLIFVTNSINLIDGLDALAGGISYSIALWPRPFSSSQSIIAGIASFTFLPVKNPELTIVPFATSVNASS